MHFFCEPLVSSWCVGVFLEVTIHFQLGFAGKPREKLLFFQVCLKGDLKRKATLLRCEGKASLLAPVPGRTPACHPSSLEALLAGSVQVEVASGSATAE